MQRLVAGENQLKIWREHRGLTRYDLSEQAGVSQPSIAQLETGQRTGSLDMLRKSAKILDVDIGGLISTGH